MAICDLAGFLHCTAPGGIVNTGIRVNGAPLEWCISGPGSFPPLPSQLLSESLGTGWVNLLLWSPSSLCFWQMPCPQASARWSRGKGVP